jgi:hypothetical protein
MTKTMTPAELREWRIREIESRDGPNCFYPPCLKPFKSKDEITFDHWIPQSKGGTWDIENLRLMHKRCNAVKGDDMPLPDGTLPPKKREPNSAERRAMRRGERQEVCTSCMSGRLLGPDDCCEACGSMAMPPRHPQWSKMKPQDCTHEGIWWCWACMSGVIERVPAIYDVLDARGLDVP